MTTDLASSTSSLPSLLQPIASPKEMMQAHEMAVGFIRETLQQGVDYGPMPGTKAPKEGEPVKQVLFKPGAERLTAGYGFIPEFEIIEHEVDHGMDSEYVVTKWFDAPKPPDQDTVTDMKADGRGRFRKQNGQWVWQESNSEIGISLGLYRYVMRCTLSRQGVVVGQGVGSCSSLESKYIRAPRDSENTILKMAKKRAFVDAVLTTLGLSDRFTQDVEDMHANAVARGDAPLEQEPGQEPSRATPREKRNLPSDATTRQHANTLMFEKGWLVKTEDGKFVLDAALAEQFALLGEACQAKGVDPFAMIVEGIGESCQTLDDLTFFVRSRPADSAPAAPDEPVVLEGQLVEDGHPKATTAGQDNGEKAQESPEQTPTTTTIMDGQAETNPPVDEYNPFPTPQATPKQVATFIKGQVKKLGDPDLCGEVYRLLGVLSWPDIDKEADFPTVAVVLRGTLEREGTFRDSDSLDRAAWEALYGLLVQIEAKVATEPQAITTWRNAKGTS